MDNPTREFPTAPATEPALLRRDFMELVGPHVAVLKRFAVRLARNPHDGEDLFQDVMLKLYEHRERVDAVQFLQPWLMRVMYHHFVDQCRRSCPLSGATSIHALTELADGAGETLVTESHEVPEHLVQRMQLADAVTLAIGRLPTQQRTMIKLHDIEGLSLPEIARRLTLSVNTVKSGLSRARDSLRTSLKSVGGAAVSGSSRRRRTAATAALRIAAP